MKKKKLKKISLTGRYTTKILTYHIDLTAKAIQTSIEEVKKGGKD
ncbi:hypothetical protein [Treponema denticola]|nr:hypothetical protein [Treponema denticola]